MSCQNSIEGCQPSACRSAELTLNSRVRRHVRRVTSHLERARPDITLFGDQRKIDLRYCFPSAYYIRNPGTHNRNSLRIGSGRCFWNVYLPVRALQTCLNGFGDCMGQARNGLKLFKARSSDRLDGSEGLQQGLTSCWPDTGDALER